MNQDWFYEFVECDSRCCPARVKGYYGKKGQNDSSADLLLGFCTHHFFFYESVLTEQGFDVVARDGILIRDHRYDNLKGGVKDVST